MAGPLTYPVPPESAVLRGIEARDQHQKTTEPLRALAHRYRQAAGVAFAAGEDEQALAFRKAAESLDALVSTLPAIPATTR